MKIAGEELTMPVGIWSRISSFLVFSVVLLFWQRMQSLFFFPRMVFVDKFCIDQLNQDRKSRAILSLAITPACCLLDADILFKIMDGL